MLGILLIHRIVLSSSTCNYAVNKTAWVFRLWFSGSEQHSQVVCRCMAISCKAARDDSTYFHWTCTLQTSQTVRHTYGTCYLRSFVRTFAGSFVWYVKYACCGLHFVVRAILDVKLRDKMPAKWWRAPWSEQKNTSFYEIQIVQQCKWMPHIGLVVRRAHDSTPKVWIPMCFWLEESFFPRFYFFFRYLLKTTNAR